MMEFAERLRGELSGLLDVIHRAGGRVVFEEFPGSLEEDTSSAKLLDGASSAARTALIEEANRLAETLEQLRRGEDGIATREVEAGSRQKWAGATVRPGPSAPLARPL
jgi:hypothetical protein